MVAATFGSLLVAMGSGAGAQGPCVVPAELRGFANPAPAGTILVPGRAVRVKLVQDARLAVAPEKAPAAGSFAGSFPVTVARAGRYRVAVDGPYWIDVVRGGAALVSAAHGHAPGCSGARKLVGYDLSPGRYSIQLSGAPAAGAVMMLVAG